MDKMRVSLSQQRAPAILLPKSDPGLCMSAEGLDLTQFDPSQISLTQPGPGYN